MKKETANRLKMLINREFPWMRTIVYPDRYDNKQYCLMVYVLEEKSSK